MKIFHSTEEVEKEYLPNYFMKRITSEAIEGKTGAVEKFVDLLFEKVLVMVTPPRELPDGCTFTNIELESEE